MLHRSHFFPSGTAPRRERETSQSGEASPHSKKVTPKAERKTATAAKDRRSPYQPQPNKPHRHKRGALPRAFPTDANQTPGSRARAAATGSARRRRTAP